MARVKVQKGEKLDADNVERVIEFLNNGGKKKEAYDMLNIKANSSRLARIIEEHEERKATAERLRKANRGKPATPIEIQEIIKGALEGEGITVMADNMFRSVQFVKDVIERVGIPQKLPGSWWDRRFKTSIPDQCMADTFDKYEIVWSDKYQGLAIVLDPGEKTTGIYVIEKVENEPDFAIGGRVYTGYGGFHSQQPNCELGSLEHLKEYGVDLYKPYVPYFPKWLS